MGVLCQEDSLEEKLPDKHFPLLLPSHDQSSPGGSGKNCITVESVGQQVSGIKSFVTFRMKYIHYIYDSVKRIVHVSIYMHLCIRIAVLYTDKIVASSKIYICCHKKTQQCFILKCFIIGKNPQVGHTLSE